MNKIKEMMLIVLASLAFIMITGTAKSESITPQEFVNNLTQVPAKLQNHISNEIVKTKEFQKKSWADAKIQFLNLKKIFIKD
tara:strand:- start:58 stop:303 length:246 start_codon:yes stop_codon:yes gene_type:complete